VRQSLVTILLDFFHNALLLYQTDDCSLSFRSIACTSRDFHTSARTFAEAPAGTAYRELCDTADAEPGDTLDWGTFRHCCLWTVTQDCLGTVLQTVSGTLRHSCLGTLLHCCRGTWRHFCSGTLMHSCLGTLRHCSLGTLRHSFFATVVQLCLGTFLHCWRGTLRHSCLATCLGTLVHC